MCNKVGVPELYITLLTMHINTAILVKNINVVDHLVTSKMADHNAVSLNNDLGKIKYMAFADDLVMENRKISR